MFPFTINLLRSCGVTLRRLAPLEAPKHVQRRLSRRGPAHLLFPLLDVLDQYKAVVLLKAVSRAKLLPILSYTSASTRLATTRMAT